MGNAISVAALGAAISAVDLVNFLHARQGQGASARVAAHQAPSSLHSGGRDLLLLASAAGFSVSVAFIYRHVHRGARAAAEGAGNRRVSEIESFMLCVCAGVLQFCLFARVPVPGSADAVDPGEQARALGLAALRVLPAAASVTFFLGTTLIVAAHIRAGGEGGGTGGAIAVLGEEPIQVQAPRLGLRLLSRLALAAAAALFCLMAVAVYGAYNY